MKSWLNRWRWTVAVGAMGALAAGCGNNIPEPQSVQSRAELISFSGAQACQDLEKYIEDSSVLQMKTELEAQRDGVPSWGWWGGGWFGRGGIDDFSAAPNAETAGASQAKAPGPTDYTTTNNQVAGVDEADFVKNDGTRIFVLSGNKLYASNSWPADTLAVQGKLNIEGYPREMFLEGKDRVIVFSSIYRWYPMSQSQGVSCDAMRCGYYNANTVKVTVVDVSNMAAPTVSHEYYVPGQYNSGRMVGSSIRLVLSDSFDFPQGFKWSPDWSEGLWNDQARLRAAYDKIIADNETLIRKQTLAQWVPAATANINGRTVTLPHACSAFSRVNAPTRLGSLSVVTLNMAKPDTLDRTSIIGQPGEVYASAKNLYVATRHWWWWPAPGQRDTTYLHKFDISQPDRAHYVASGTADGHIVDQFSMDENSAGFFRIATTINTRVPDTRNANNWWGRMETTNRVQVLGENSGRLEVIGRSEELAKGERIMSSRFIENKAFVVTFLQVDPLFTFDMTDPRNPKKVGELKIPGFSTYLHPIDENHLLTIGTFVPEPVNGVNPDWRSRALQLTIFDVTDMTAPKQSHVQLVGTSNSYSEAQHDHKAFNYFPAKKLLAIPFTDWSYDTSGNDYWSRFTSDLRVFSVDANTGFVPRGALSMNDLYQVNNYYNWSYYWTPRVRRSVMADDFVYAISDAGIRVAHINNLSQPLRTAAFDRYIEH